MVPVIAIILWLLPVVSQATVYYVATTGSNANDGISESTPFLTIDKCAQLLVAGDTCYVRGGTYTESGGVRIKASGTASLPIQLLAYPGETPVISFPSRTSTNRILVTHASGDNVAMGYITISGFEIKNGWEGIKFTSMHNSTIRQNWIHDGQGSGILGIGGHHNLFEKNIINHQGDFSGCAAGTALCNQQHGMYMHGDSYTIRNNVIYDNIAVGIQQNGSSTSTYSATRHPSVEFSGAANWIVDSNTVAYQANASGYNVWSTLTNNTRIENNIFYENRVIGTSAQAIFFTGNGMTGVSIKNNHSYASGSGGTAFIGALSTTPITEGVQYTQSGNVVNVSAPAFVNGGSNALPASPDFRLTASAPVNIALANEFTNNSTSVVGAFKTVANPSASITTNKITLNFPMSTAVPIQNLSTTGLTVGCTGSACPGSPTVSAVSKIVNTDAQVEVTISGIAGDACASLNQAWTISYNASTGSWSGNDDIGPYSGSNQKIFSFTNLAVTNQCTGSGPSGYPAGYYIHYKFDEGTGTSANDESANNLDGTLTNGPTWGAGKTGSGVVLAGNNTQHVAIPYGNGVNPSTQSLTIAFGVNIPSGNETLSRDYFGAPLGTNQRLYISTVGSTWRLGIQGSSNSTAGDIAVTSGWHHVCLVMNSTLDLATLYIDGFASASAGSLKSYTSYTLAGDFDLGRIADIATGGGGGTYEDLLIYQSVEDCASISSAFNAAPPSATGTLAQAAIQFQGVVLDTAGSPITIGAAVTAIEVPAGGGAVLLLQVHCQNIANCDPTSFKLVYAQNGSSTWQQVPDTETADGTFMWGTSPAASLNTGTRTTRLTGSCAMTTGQTQLTAAQIPAIDLPQDGCTVLAYVVRVGATHAGDYYDYKLRTEANVDFSAYTQIARVRVVNPMASGIGF